MAMFNMFKKIILWFFIIIFLAATGLILFFPFDSFITEKVNSALAPHNISVSSVNVRWGNIVASDILAKTPAGSDSIKIKRVTISPSFLGLLKKQVDIKNIAIDSPILIIKRTKQNKWLMPVPDIKKETEKKDEKPSIEVIVKVLEVSNGKVVITDELKSFKMEITNVTVDVNSKTNILQDKMTISTSAKLPNDGKIVLKSDGEIPDKNFKGNLLLKDFDMTLLGPYMGGDVRVKKGRLNLESNFSIVKEYIKAPSTLKLKDMDLESKGVLMGISAPLVLGLLKKEGEIAVNFNVWGNMKNPQNDLKDVFKKKMLASAQEKITSPLKSIGKSIKGLMKP